MEAVLTLHTFTPRSQVQVVQYPKEPPAPETIAAEEYAGPITNKLLDWSVPKLGIPEVRGRGDSRQHWMSGKLLRLPLNALKPVTLRATPYNRGDVVGALLNCRDVRSSVFENKLKAFTSQYGLLIGMPLIEFMRHEGSQFFPIDMVEASMKFLERFRTACLEGRGRTIREMIVDKWGDTARSIYFEPAFDEASERLVPQLVVHSLHQYCMHELLGLYFDRQTMSTCLSCGKISFDQGRADKKYCSPRCRVAAHRRGKGTHID